MRKVYPVIMKSRKAIAAAVGIVIILSLCGTLAARTVFAAEKAISVTDTKESSEAVLGSNTDSEVLKVYKKTVYNDTGCTVILPNGYTADGNVAGMYISDRSPMDSSNIYYTVSEDADAEVLREVLDSGDYRNRVEQRFKEAYGAKAAIGSFLQEKVQVDGCPAYRIKLSCTLNDMTMEQLIYVIAADKVYTITYSQSADDERMEDFEKSARTIRMSFRDTEERIS